MSFGVEYCWDDGIILAMEETMKHSQREYQRRCYQAYKQRTKNPPKLWQLDSKSGLYFCGVSSSGKEIWRSKEFMVRKRQMLKDSKSRRIERIKSLPDLGLKLGDPCPDNPGLVVVHKAYNKVYFGTMDRLVAKRKRWMELHRLRKKNDKVA